MSYLFTHKSQEQFYIFQTTLWSAQGFNQLPRAALLNVDTEAWTALLSRLIAKVEKPFFDAGLFNYLGFTESCVLTEFLSSFNTRVVTIQFHCIYQSPDVNLFPHVIGVDICVCEEGAGFIASPGQFITQDSSSTTFKLL